MLLSKRLQIKSWFKPLRRQATLWCLSVANLGLSLRENLLASSFWFRKLSRSIFSSQLGLAVMSHNLWAQLSTFDCLKFKQLPLRRTIQPNLSHRNQWTLHSPKKTKSNETLNLTPLPSQKAAHLEMEGLIDLRIDTNANNHIVQHGSIVFRQRELLDANGRTLLGKAFDLERIMDDIDAFIADYNRGNCKWH